MFQLHIASSSHGLNLAQSPFTFPGVWVAPGGYPPEAPADPYVRALTHTVLPIMGWPADGRSIERPTAVDARRSGLAIRHRCVDTRSEVDASGVFPDDESMIGRPPSLHRVAVDGHSPCFTGTTRTLRLPAIPPAALRFLRLAVPRLRQVLLPCDRRRTLAGPGCFVAAATRRRGLRLPLTPPVARGDDRISQVPAEPSCRHAHAPSTPEESDGTRLLTLHPTRPRVRERP
jgi:hypothetical protein